MAECKITLLLCDGRSVDAARDLGSTMLHYLDREGEVSLSVRFGAGHWWKYAGGMVPEMLIMSGFVFSVKIVGLITVGLV